MFRTTGTKKNKSCKVHRLVAETFFAYLDCEVYEVNHMNGDKANNSIYNLNWMTRSENLRHAVETNLLKPRFGKENGMFKHSDEDIKALDNLREEGHTYSELGFLMDLTPGSVWSLLNRRRK